MPRPIRVRSTVNRRDALRAAGAVGAALVVPAVHADSPSTDVIRVGLVGAGGRGTGALQQALSVPGSNVKVTAIADAFEEQIGKALKAMEGLEEKIDVPQERRFSGLDAWRKLIDLPGDECNLVILATPPGFRPFHFAAAVEAGKHVFMEKPVCVDSFGARMCLDAARLADDKNLKVVVGLQRRYDPVYRETVARVHEGMAGDILGGQVYWNGVRPFFRTRRPEMSELQYQVDNWYHFNWLCGDHIVEQHVHNIDVANWMLDAIPQSAFGIGGQQVRVPSQSSEIYDHHAVNFAYASGARISSQCRQFPGGDNRVGEEFQGTKGFVRIGEIVDHAGKVLWRYEGPRVNPYQAEHDELHDAIRRDVPLNNAHYGTTSSFAAVLGRMATYSGKEQGWEAALALPYRTMPENLTWDTKPPVEPDANGIYPLPMPATFKIT